MPKGKAQKLTPEELERASRITEEDVEAAKKRASKANPKLGRLVNAKTEREEDNNG